MLYSNDNYPNTAIENYKVAIELQPFYHNVNGNDNTVLCTSRYYHKIFIVNIFNHVFDPCRLVCKILIDVDILVLENIVWCNSFRVKSKFVAKIQIQ